MLAATVAQAQAPLSPDIIIFGDDAGHIQRLPYHRATTDKIAAPVYSQTLVFRDGRELRGELVEMNQDAVVWQRPDASEALCFPRGEVRRIASPISMPDAGGAFPAPLIGQLDRVVNATNTTVKPAPHTETAGRRLAFRRFLRWPPVAW